MLPAPVFTIVLGFFGPALANFSFGLERYQLASVLLHFVSIRTMIATAIAAASRDD
jgi:hypothetical protein